MTNKDSERKIKTVLDEFRLMLKELVKAREVLGNVEYIVEAVAGARETLKTVELLGLDFVKGSQAHAPRLQYGLEYELFDQFTIESAETKYQTSKAREALRNVELLGLDFVKRSEFHALHLQYGLKYGLFDQSVIEIAQKRYEAGRKP